jgi:hypothetical protein
MKDGPRSLFPLVLAALLGCVPAGTASGPIGAATATAQDGLPCDQLGSIIGGRAQLSNGICRVNLPRGDLDVSLLGAKLPTGMGLTSWAAFHAVEPGVSMVMGDLALTPRELPQVMSGLRENGLEVAAVHRHMLGETPSVVFMHYMGTGDPVELARKLDASLQRAPSAKGRAPAASAPGSQQGSVAGTPCNRIEQILGAPSGSADTGAGYCKITLPRPAGEVSMMGVPVPPALGIASWFAFKQTEDGNEAVIAGDMALREEQVNPAIAALRQNGVEVVVLHNHMMGEEPRIMFFHFQARGNPIRLAEGLRAGIDAAARVAPVTGSERRE